MRGLNEIVKRLALALLFVAPCAATSRAKATRFLTGDAADVSPRLHGPAYDFAGGGTDVAEAFQWMIDEVRGCDSCGAKIDVVVLRASGGAGYNDLIYKMRGVDSVETLLIRSREEAEEPGVAETVRKAEVVFFAGGDQCNYVKFFKGGPVERAVESVVARGGGVGGTSAGLAVMGEVSYDACSGGSETSAQALANPYHADISFTYDFFRWKPLRGAITDTHFIERDRLGRTLVFLARQIADGKYRHILGVAVERETSLVVDKKGRARVLGKGPAYFILADHRPEVCEPGVPLTYSNYKVWKVGKGGTFDLAHRPITGYYTISVERGKLSPDAYRTGAAHAGGR
ncbi:MAG: peptidase S51 [Acidobacteriota bacterium]|nr:peptidase S51 [Acidobacteriota bacterium]